MLTEDYVSLETAKLLKEKGFDDIPVYTYYLSYGCFYMTPMAVTNKDLYAHGHIAAPTLQMAMKWLREKYNIHMYVKSYDSLGWKFVLHRLNVGSKIWPNGFYSTYEEACEAAIKYCLENLI